ncbi:MAG: phosphoribosylformylglycinamidine synthase subunit PurL [Candidatus Hydrothermarchaeota archaeon]
MKELYRKVNVPFHLYEINLIEASDEELERISKERSLGLNLYEMKKIREYFRKEGRNPYDIELESIAQAWSEHCCYKTSKPILKTTIFDTKAPQCIFVIEEDAGVVEFDDNYAYVVALESHNHPSALDPYGGAATGVGGILRDVVCMGAQPIALVDSLFFGPLDYPEEKLPLGTKHPSFLFRGVVKGIGDYGNRVGIPTLAGCVVFDESYVTNCLVNVGCIGIVRKDKIIRSIAKKPGEIFLLAGGKTGRDGIHGVTFASAELTEKSEEEDRPAVQLGDPITKEPLIHACLESVEKGLVEGLKDLGGGGLSCVIGEMALAGGNGAHIRLEKVPLKVEGMAPWEIWVSESQERMMLCVKKENLEEVLEIFDFWDVQATPIGEVIEGNRIIVEYSDKKILDMDIKFLTGALTYNRPYKVVKRDQGDPKIKEPDYEEIFLKVLSSLNVCNKEWVIRQYDHEVRGNTVIKPLQGIINRQSHGDSAVIKPLDHSFRGLAIASDVNINYTKIDPYWGAASSVEEVFRNLAAVGAHPHSLADCLNFGNPEKPERLGDFRECCRGMYFVASSFKIPFVSGNVSFYNESPLLSVAPTPTLLGVGIMEDVRKAVTIDIKGSGNYLYVIGETKKEMGGSEYYKALNVNGGKVPRVNIDESKKNIYGIIDLISKGLIESCHDLSNGGLAVALSESLIAGDIGAEIDLRGLNNLRSDIKLFSESNSRFLIEIEGKNREKVEDFCKRMRIPIKFIGKTKKEKTLEIKEKKELISLPLEEIWNAWNAPIFRFMEG